MLEGMLTVYKEAGFTSNDVVAKLRGILHMKKIGHTGTLDPDAVGVLPVCLGKGTKLCDMIADRDKEYVAVLRLGVQTDTQDMSGQVLNEVPVEEVLSKVTMDKLSAACASFTGEYDQIPPMYSALKVNGKKLYELARAGVTIERKARRIHIYELEIQKVELPLVTIRVRCSKGTYIRTLCEDIGETLGVHGAMQSLLRTRVGQFTLAEALTLSQLETLSKEGEEAVRSHVIAIDAFFSEYPSYQTKKDQDRFLHNGNRLPLTYVVLMQGEAVKSQDEKVRLYDSEGRFMGVYQYEESEKILAPVKMFGSVS